MKALAYEKAHTLDAWAIELADVAEPTPGGSDVLVEVHAVGINPGDRVFGTGDMRRDGAWAERVTVDDRVVAAIPDALSYTDAASLPIGAITVWEAIFRDADALPVNVNRALAIGGAGGLGSLPLHLLQAQTQAFVIATASRPESRACCVDMVAGLVVDHAGDVI